MKYLIVVVFVLATMVLGSSVCALGQGSAQERAGSLRSQLSELETKQSELQARLQGLEENLKPANIELHLAGIGSTRPEDLRAQRRRQLEIERNGVRTQLDLLAASRTRLEASLARADADAYLQSAAAPSVAPQPVAPTNVLATTSRDSPIVVADTKPLPRRRIKKKRIRRARRSHHLQTSLIVVRSTAFRRALSSNVRLQAALEAETSVVQPAASQSSRGGSGVSTDLFAARGW